MTELYYNVDMWYDSLNDSHDITTVTQFVEPENYTKWCKYVYVYLSCIDTFPDDYE